MKRIIAALAISATAMVMGVMTSLPALAQDGESDWDSIAAEVYADYHRIGKDIHAAHAVGEMTRSHALRELGSLYNAYLGRVDAERSAYEASSPYVLLSASWRLATES